MTAGVWLYRHPAESIVPESELRFSIRSAVRYMGVDEVWLIGERPEWAVNVGHIPGIEDTGSKFRTLYEDLLRACERDDFPSRFVLMNDDFHALRDYAPTVEHGGLLYDRVKSWNDNFAGPFGLGLMETYRWLVLHGIEEPLSYELHRPLLMQKRDVRSALREGLLHGQVSLSPLHARTVYGNLCAIGGRGVNDLKLVGLGNRGDWQTLDLVSTAESGWQGKPGNWLRAQSPDPSPFER